MRLSENFELYEFTRSQDASRLGIDNTPSSDVVRELGALVSNVLQPLRDYLGRPIFISSGYRSPKLNSHIGGASDSQHMAGQAADFECWSVSNVRLFHAIRYRFAFDQLILERHDPNQGPNSGWIHLSYKSNGDNRGEAFRLP